MLLPAPFGPKTATIDSLCILHLILFKILVLPNIRDKLEINDTYNAAQKFLEAELLFPQSNWAPQSALMASYSYYIQNYYSEAVSNLNRFLKTYPKNENVVYAHYLIGICYYEMIEDEKRDINPILKSKEKFELIIENYPNTDFALDSKF